MDRRVLPVYRLITPWHLVPALMVVAFSIVGPVSHHDHVTSTDGPQFKEWLDQQHPHCPLIFTPLG